MKKIFFIMLLAACHSLAFSQIKSANLTASGLTCSMCSKAIYKALLKLPYVAAVDVDIDKSIYSISFKPGAVVAIDGVKNAVEKAGFYVASFKIKIDVPKTEVYNDAHVDIASNTFHFLNIPKQAITGEQVFTIVDKGFVSAAEYKRYKGYTQMKCIETGFMGSCCPNGMSRQTRIYHVTL